MLKLWPLPSTARDGSGYQSDWLEYIGSVKSGTPRSTDLIALVTRVWMSTPAGLEFTFGSDFSFETVAPMMLAISWTEAKLASPATVVLMVFMTTYTAWEKAVAVGPGGVNGSRSFHVGTAPWESPDPASAARAGGVKS